MSIERLTDAFQALGHDGRNDITYEEFLKDHQLIESDGIHSSLLNFDDFIQLILEYENKLDIEEEALRQLDPKIAFEYFDLNKGKKIISYEYMNHLIHRRYD